MTVPVTVSEGEKKANVKKSVADVTVVEWLRGAHEEPKIAGRFFSYLKQETKTARMA